ncbi:maleylacetoacetate isomerase [Nitratireductor sp. CH_MIT9313-5]|jgi:maleylpyruvate isomerase|uniref:maleylacetoacetate isomerase n=1 Tax=Nitratireductor sp. CH_MIT9313-5 TaxID=3107764 RepID=UPI0030085E60
MSKPVLHSYFRSSTSYRVRIALEMKGITYQYRAHHLREGEHRKAVYLAVNPQGLVPALVWSDGTMIAQSLAIIEYLDEMVSKPRLLPKDAGGRARVRMLSQMIACDIHPLNNLRVLNALQERFGAGDSAITAWFRHWVHETFEPLERMLAESEDTGRFCHGDEPGMADICLVAQVTNNRRFQVDMDPYPTINRINSACLELEPFRKAAPENQPDAE